MPPSDTAVAAVIKSDPARRFTFSVAYPALRKDGHGEFATPETIEQTAWDWMARSRKVGLYHADGLVGYGTVVENTIWRGPDWHVADVNGHTQVIKAGDWCCGIIWDEPAWNLILSGKADGLSIQGQARHIRTTFPTAA